MEPDGSIDPRSESGVGTQRTAQRGAVADDPNVRAESLRPGGMSASAAELRRRGGPAPRAAAGVAGSNSTRPTGPVTRPTPLPKRPKGRLFVGTILLSVCLAGLYGLWNALFRYRAYGIVTGRVIEVSAPWNGIVRGLYAREGEPVRQGQLLVTLENLELTQRRDRLADELQIAQASLSAEVAQLQWQSQLQEDRSQRALAEYYQLWGKLLQEQAELAERTRKLERIRRLADRGVMSVEKIDEVRFGEAGQRAKIEKLAAAVEEMKRRVEVIQSNELPDRLHPQLARIEALQAEISRLGEQVAQGEIRAAVSGRVINTRRFTGEYAKAAEPILEILEDGSLEAVVYLPQRSAGPVRLGQKLSVSIEPHAKPVTCAVVRVGDRLETAPESIQRHYRANETLLPIYARLPSATAGAAGVRLGSEVRLPAGWSELWSWLPAAPAGEATGRAAPLTNP